MRTGERDAWDNFFIYIYIYIYFFFFSFMYVIKYKANKGIVDLSHSEAEKKFE